MPDIAVEVNLVPDNIEPVPVAVPTVQFDPQMAKSHWYGCVGWILGALKIHEMFLKQQFHDLEEDDVLGSEFVSTLTGIRSPRPLFLVGDAVDVCGPWLVVCVRCR